MNTLKHYGPVIGRILMAFIFLFAGFGKVMGFAGTAAFIASKGVPLPELAAVGAILVELGGSLSMILGYKTRWAAAALFVFTALTALIFHNFWAVAADQAQNQMIHFMKNVSIMGGLLYVVVYGSGPLALDKED